MYSINDIFADYVDNERTIAIGFYDAHDTWFYVYEPNRPSEFYNYSLVQEPRGELMIRFRRPGKVYGEMPLAQLAHRRLPD